MVRLRAARPRPRGARDARVRAPRSRPPGPDRFAAVAERWRALAARRPRRSARRARAARARRGRRVRLRARRRRRAALGRASRPASLHVPEVALARRGDEVRLTLAALVAPRRRRRGARRRGSRRARPSCAARRCRCSTPIPAGRFARRRARCRPSTTRTRSRAPSSASARARCDKIVLAREVQVHARAPRTTPARVLGVLREAFPTATSSRSAAATRAFLAASPELLVRREGLRAGTLALAGSTRRSADPAVDDHLGEQLLRSAKDREEQAIVVRRIVRALRPLSVWVTPRRGARARRRSPTSSTWRRRSARSSREPVSVVELAGAAAPDAGRRRRAARGRRAADPGARGPGPRLVRRARSAGSTRTRTASSASRCAARCCTGAVARCYAGVGVVRDSDPAAELAETEVKLQALLPVLAS